MFRHDSVCSLSKILAAASPCARKAAPTLAPRSTDSQAGTLGGYGISGPRSRADTGGRANTLSATLFAARNRVPSEARQREGGLIKRPRTEPVSYTHLTLPTIYSV